MSLPFIFKIDFLLEGKTFRSSRFYPSKVPFLIKAYTYSRLPKVKMEFLKPSQIDHFERLLSILEVSGFACDFSVMGSGKTHVACAIAGVTGLSLFVLGPRGSLTHWEKTARGMGAQIAFTCTYESLRSVRGCQPKNGYLKRYDYNDGTTDFAVTDSFRDLSNKGILLVCDECQKIKNDSCQNKAVRALVRCILEEGGITRLLLLSGSPFEEAKHAINFFRFMGFITHPMLYNITKTGEFIPLGLNELITNLEELDPEETEKLVLECTPFNKQNVSEFCFLAFTEIIVPLFTSAMPSPVIDYPKDVGNGYYRFEEETQREKLIAAIHQLEKASAYNSGNGTVDYGNANMGMITIALKEIESAKVPLFIRKARENLSSDPKCKVVLFFNYTSSVDEVVEALGKDYETVVYDGRLNTRKQEDKALSAFQNGSARLFVGNLKKGGIAISLHDTEGDKPRYCYISPTYSIIDMHQASNRVWRYGIKSAATIRIVYGFIGEGILRMKESKILNALSRKTENMKKILKQQAKEGVLFPGEYPEYIEEDISRY
jgi:hypothetical protein